ncbi:oligosaccharide flippase family protein [uncultured Mucilaginibacter sp.]|uniref:oligosaccharide flippase family protein n=1 Tax=uncultured Mucilaginibacter sp. TaxID=797541 RepID=UPI0025D504D5|nr:oligosaccharide flippase family protein [uncultured Mucilaginibacter sp.]
MMMKLNLSRIKKFDYRQSTLVKNSIWGILANGLQILFVFLFFSILARRYSAPVFAQFLISTTVYQLIAAFSSMGLGQWFIRQYVTEDDQPGFTAKFLKTQLGLGIAFYLVNIVVAYMLYDDDQIRNLCLILGTNIIFDNFINAIKSLNVVQNEQRKTASILVIDGFLRLLIGVALFIYVVPITQLAVAVIVVRLLTLGLFIKVGSSDTITLRAIGLAKINYADLKGLIVKNWQFIVIGSISIIYWKIGNILISKILTLQSVANYEVAFRIFSVLQIMPVIASTTIYPQFIKFYNEGNLTKLNKLYKNVFVGYTIFALASYTFIYLFSDFIIPTAFGSGYPGAIECLQQMFLTFLILPTVLLQANLLVAIGLEKLDMWFNVVSLLINIVGCLAGLYFFKSLAAVNYSVFASFLIFHLLQDFSLIKKQFMTLKHCIIFYTAISITILGCIKLAPLINPYAFFMGFLVIAGMAAFAFFANKSVDTLSGGKA